MKFPKYNPKSKCPKCGNKDVGENYHKPYCYERYSDSVCNGIDCEHILRICKKCHYDWLESPLDAK